MMKRVAMNREYGKVLFYFAADNKMPFGFIELDYVGDESNRPEDLFFCRKNLGESCGRIGRRIVKANQRVSFIRSNYKGRAIAADVQIENNVAAPALPALDAEEINWNR